MKFTIKQKDLNQALSFVMGGVEKKNTIPVLSNLLIESLGENAVQITTTDLDLTIRRTAEAEISKTGTMLINAVKLAAIVNSLPDGDCHFEKDKKQWVTLTHGRSKFRFAGTDRSNFPEIPSFKSTPIAVPAETFRDLVHKTSFAVASAKSGTNYAVKDNIKLEVKDGIVRMVGIEGRCMSIADRPLEADSTLDALVQKKTLVEAAKISEGELRVGCDDHHIFIESDDQLIISRLPTYTFPSYQMLVGDQPENSVTFDRDAMRLAIRRAAVMSDSRHLSIRMEIKADEITVTSRTRDEGEATEVIDASYKGNDTRFGFFYQYIGDFLNVTDGKQPITFAWSNKPNTPCQMGVVGDEGFKFVIVPLNLEVTEKIDAAKASKAAQVQ